MSGQCHLLSGRYHLAATAEFARQLFVLRWVFDHPSAVDRPVRRYDGETVNVERPMVNARKTEDGGQRTCDGGSDVIILDPQWPGVFKAGRRPALRPRANGNNGTPVCHRLKPCLSATPVRSVEGECARSPSRHTQSRSQTGAPAAQEASGAGLEAVKTAPRDAGRPDPPG